MTLTNMNAFSAKINLTNEKAQYRSHLKILQVNIGNVCNQKCQHCHVDASPDGREVMTSETMDDILEFLKKEESLTLDITGGAPEMNPNFEYFVLTARPITKEIIVRSNLTVFFEEGKNHLPSFFKENKVHLMCSLPCYTRENVDSQRGSGVFEKSIKALKALNEEGYARDEGLAIDLVYNPGGAFLPVPQKELERDYKEKLQKEYNIEFNRLITIINAPINRFKINLKEKNEYDGYMDLLESNFNEDIVGNIMCRTLLSAGWDGSIYDCDFNQAVQKAIKDTNGRKINIKDLDPKDLCGREIFFNNHCFCCTAGAGSSCQGVLE